ncbi:thioesterase family protein [Inquilinus limosus]|uniref:thioesterase family protein n=1 Tax=Inquilinus limosus TaxID=171674 RepID=UPI003F180143
MNLYLRLIRVVVAALFGRRIGLLDESVLRFRVWPNDLDLNLHMNNGRYLTVMDLGRFDLMLRAGLAGTIRRRRWMPVLGAATIRYRRSLAAFAGYRLRSRLLGWDEKWLYLEQGFEDTRGAVAAHAVVKAAFLHRGGTVPTAEIAAALGWRGPSPALPAYVLALRDGEEAMREGLREGPRAA